MRKYRLCILTALLTLIISVQVIIFHSSAAYADFAHYIGEISVGSGLVVYPTSGGQNWNTAVLHWDIQQISATQWHYSYDFNVPDGKHINTIYVEAKPGLTLTEIQNVTVPYSANISSYPVTVAGSSLSFMSIQFNRSGPTGNQWTVAFDTSYAPIWGDFYAKDANFYAWNSGFVVADPTVAPDDGPEQGHILVPGAVVPIPPAAWLLGSGLLGLVAFRRRFKK